MTQVQDALATEEEVQANPTAESAPEREPEAPTSPEEEPRPSAPETTGPDIADRVAAQLSGIERGLTARLANQERQLSRLEGRLDRGQDPAAVKELRAELRKEIAAVQTSLQDIANQRQAAEQLDALQQELTESREALDLVLKRTLDADELSAYERKRESDRATRAAARAEKLRAQLEERAAKAEKALAQSLATVSLPPSPEPATPAFRPAATGVPADPANDPEVIEATRELTTLITAAEYNPEDPALVQRLIARAGDLGAIPTAWARYRVMARAFAQIQAEDRKATSQAAIDTSAKADGEKRKADEAAAAKKKAAAEETERRQAARGAVQTDRTRAAGVNRSYTSIRDLEADYAADKIGTADFKRHREQILLLQRR